MEDAYLILRDNQEKGLFKLGELANFPLHPDDLIWVVGKSTCWQFPTEITDLQPYIKPTIQQQQSGIFSLSKNNLFPADTIIPKPYVYVQLPERKIPESSEKTRDSEEEINADKLEQKAKELYQRVMVFEKQKPEKKEVEKENALQVMKEEFARWKAKKERQAKNNVTKKWVVAVGITGMASAILFMVPHSITAPEKPIQQAPSVSIKNEVQPPLIKADAALQTVAYAPNEGLPSSQTQTLEPQPLSVDEFIDSVENVLARHDKNYKRNKPLRIEERMQ